MLTVTIPGLRLVSEANMRENPFVKARRTKHQKTIVPRDLTTFARIAGYTPPPHPIPLVVTMTRIGKGTMDTDNLEGSAKHVRDAIADWLGRDDGEKGMVLWVTKQRKSDVYGVEIRIETAEQARGSRREEVA